MWSLNISLGETPLSDSKFCSEGQKFRSRNSPREKITFLVDFCLQSFLKRSCTQGDNVTPHRSIKIFGAVWVDRGGLADQLTSFSILRKLKKVREYLDKGAGTTLDQAKAKIKRRKKKPTAQMQEVLGAEMDGEQLSSKLREENKELFDLLKPFV